MHEIRVGTDQELGKIGQAEEAGSDKAEEGQASPSRDSEQMRGQQRDKMGKRENLYCILGLGTRQAAGETL